jgi:hypothetical protein
MKHFFNSKTTPEFKIQLPGKNYSEKWIIMVDIVGP